ncbi:ATP-grasp domain-containing protein [Paenibacillus fonticola]|uniref:ATP-grasp domain-containing protein n=1 Tax=Paenibacillus fonticola TaxID=379896 RepID=UPI0003A5217C|nr:ATP-grasp domain-containing protein [Paenibacillus fonticola]
MMIVIFCCEPLNDKTVDAYYESEYLGAESLGLDVCLISMEDLLLNNVNKALKSIPTVDDTEIAIYRGWMLKPQYYELLYKGLLAKNIKLINTTEEYLECHHFPNTYKNIKHRTPLSYWLEIETVNTNKLDNILDKFGDKPLIVKDYVKSRKHEWEEACFIPSAANKTQALQVINNFIQRQGEELNGGIVLREFIHLEGITKHPISGMPLSKEYRLFFLNNKLVHRFEYWDEATYDAEDKVNMDDFLEIAKEIRSNFFTIDIAKTEAGEWIVIEVGDGQVSALPEKVNVEKFYQSIRV